MSTVPGSFVAMMVNRRASCVHPEDLLGTSCGPQKVSHEALMRLGNVLSYEEYSADGGGGTSNSFTSVTKLNDDSEHEAGAKASFWGLSCLGGAGEGHGEDHAVDRWSTGQFRGLWQWLSHRMA